MKRYGNDLVKVVSSLVTTITGCWEWRGVTLRGYGRTRIVGKVQFVHRAVYEYLKGPIPEGLTIDHLCMNKACANPDHLEPVTDKENILRARNSIAYQYKVRTHCKQGHEYTEENTQIYKGARICRTCARERKRAERARAN